jgi:LPXTG-motif cell wall-anchored protein
MKKIFLVAGAAVASLAIATAPALSASATSAITQSKVITQDLGEQESSAVSPDGNIQVILDNENNTVYFAYADSETVVQVSDPGNDFDGPWSAAFSPDGSTLYVSAYSNDIIIVDVASASVSTTIPNTSPCSENQMIGLSPDGKYLVFNDDCADTYVWDVTNNFAQVGTDFGTSDDATGIFFPNSTTAYIAESDGSIAVVDLTTGSLTDEWIGTNSSLGSCANADASVVAIVPNPSDGSDLQFFNPATGDLLGAADLSESADYSMPKSCAFTGEGKVLVTDWSATPGVMYVVNASTYAYEETVSVDLGSVPAQNYTNSINVMKGCKAFVAGYDGNIAVMTLPSDYCPAAALPDTGASSSVIGTSIAVSAGLLVAGAIALIVVRRRQHS